MNKDDIPEIYAEELFDFHPVDDVDDIHSPVGNNADKSKRILTEQEPELAQENGNNKPTEFQQEATNTGHAQDSEIDPDKGLQSESENQSDANDLSDGPVEGVRTGSRNVTSWMNGIRTRITVHIKSYSKAGVRYIAALVVLALLGVVVWPNTWHWLKEFKAVSSNLPGQTAIKMAADSNMLSPTLHDDDLLQSTSGNIERESPLLHVRGKVVGNNFRKVGDSHQGWSIKFSPSQISSGNEFRLSESQADALRQRLVSALTGLPPVDGSVAQPNLERQVAEQQSVDTGSSHMGVGGDINTQPGDVNMHVVRLEGKIDALHDLLNHADNQLSFGIDTTFLTSPGNRLTGDMSTQGDGVAYLEGVSGFEPSTSTFDDNTVEPTLPRFDDPELAMIRNLSDVDIGDHVDGYGIILEIRKADMGRMLVFEEAVLLVL